MEWVFYPCVRRLAASMSVLPTFRGRSPLRVEQLQTQKGGTSSISLHFKVQRPLQNHTGEGRP